MREPQNIVGRLIARGFQSYWRRTRGMALMVQACVNETDGKVLLIRTDSGWRLPEAVVRRGETAEEAVRRCLREACGIEAQGRPSLVWIFPDAGDGARQTCLFLVREWLGGPSLPDGETAFFPAAALPAGIDPLTAERIGAALQARARPEV